MTAVNPAGRLAHDDPILESDPPRRLVYGWKPLYKDLPDERPSRVTFVLEPFKGQTRLTVTHDEFDEGSKMFAMISKGWPAVLSSLKSFLETGTGLEPILGRRTAQAGRRGMIDVAKFKPKTVYVTYIDATADAMIKRSRRWPCGARHG